MNVRWIGYGGHSDLAEKLRPIIDQLGMTLTTIHEHDNADVKWELDTWRRELEKADIIIIPTEYEERPAKSNNRLTQALALGKCVICSPLDAYVAVEQDNPGCCLFAKDEGEWKAALEALRDNDNLCRILSQEALKAAKNYSLDSIGEKWLSSLRQTEKVDIIIPTYNNLPCLKLCLDSIRSCTFFLHNIIVVNNGPDEAVHDYLQNQSDIVYIRKERLNFSQANNIGIQTGTSKYVCLLNDDTIVSKGWLTKMVETIKNHPEPVGAVGPLSNCDKNWLHNNDINIGGVELLPGVNTREQIEPIIPQIYDFKSPYPTIIERDWVAYYCTLIPRSVINDVGLLNEEYINSGEDFDHCRRIKNRGYKILQNHGSFIFHFGAVGRKILEAEDKDKYQSNDQYTQSLLHKIWDKKSVVIYSGPSWEKWDYRSLETGIGGSEIWQIWLSRELAKLGYRVINFCDCEDRSEDGDVEYRPFTEFPAFVDQNWIDNLILSRTVDPLDLPVRAGKVFVQIHDVWMLSGKEKTHMDKVTKYCALSDWHLKFASDYHGIPQDKFVLTANGIDFSRFEKGSIQRDPYNMIWASSWDRGLDNVLYLLPFIKKEIPEITLDVYYGIHNWEQSCLRKNDQEGLKKIAELKEGVKQEGITVHERVSQQELANAYRRASLLFYPGWFSETFCIGSLESQRAGCPVIANKYAGLITSLGESAILLGNGDPWYPYSKEGRQEFLNNAVEILTDNSVWQYWSKKGFENSEKYSWSKVALRWQELFIWIQ